MFTKVLSVLVTAVGKVAKSLVVEEGKKTRIYNSQSESGGTKLRSGTSEESESPAFHRNTEDAVGDGRVT